MEDDFDNWLSGRREENVANDGRLAPGTVVGDYRVVDLLGRGGFAEVYKAQDAQGRSVAIKVLHRLDDKSRSRFAREAEILAQIRHRNIPKLLGFGSCGERPYMVVELLKGGDLPRGDRRVAAFLGQIISAAAELHRHGFVHRDIKPANILWREDGTPVLIDFGLACPVSAVEREKDALSVEDGAPLVVGTVGYSAPEQFNGQGAGPEADVHAVGSLIDDCFDGKLSGCWRRIYLTATASNPKSRYHSMAELAKAIRHRHLLKFLLVGLGVAMGSALLAPVVAGLGGNVDGEPRLAAEGPQYREIFSEGLSPEEDDESVVTNAVSEIEVRLWFTSNTTQGAKSQEMKEFLDTCVERFLYLDADLLDFNTCSSEVIRRSCQDSQSLLKNFSVYLESELADRNDDTPEDRWTIGIRRLEFCPR